MINLFLKSLRVGYFPNKDDKGDFFGITYPVNWICFGSLIYLSLNIYLSELFSIQFYFNLIPILPFFILWVYCFIKDYQFTKKNFNDKIFEKL